MEYQFTCITSHPRKQARSKSYSWKLEKPNPQPWGICWWEAKKQTMGWTGTRTEEASRPKRNTLGQLYKGRYQNTRVWDQPGGGEKE